MTENVSDDAPKHLAVIDRECVKGHGTYSSEHLFAGVYEPCPKCMDENKEARKVDEVDELVYDPQTTRRLVAGITKRFESATFETFVASEDRQRHVLDMVQAYAVNFREHYRAGRSLLMTGKPGTGKTHLGISILRHCMDASPKFTGKVVSIADLFRTIKSAWGKGARLTESEAIAKFTTPHLLIIDEIGVQFDSQAEQSLLYDVINGRYQNVLPTVLISNLARVELVEVIGSRSFDRLREGGGLLASFEWDSHRGHRP